MVLNRGLVDRIHQSIRLLWECGSCKSYWPINIQCPVDHSLLWRSTDLIDFSGEEISTEPIPIGERKPYGQCAREIMDAFIPYSQDPNDFVVIHSRFHFPRPLLNIRINEFIKKIKRLVPNGSTLFLMSDSYRDTLLKSLEEYNVVLPNSPEMKVDYDRTEESVLLFAKDLNILLNSKSVIAESTVSSAIRLRELLHEAP